MVQHLAMFDFVAVSGSWEDRVIEYVDHLHGHFVDPVVVRDGRYVAPEGAGSGARMHMRSILRHQYPHGAEWLLNVGEMQVNTVK
jgi:L-fuconate dehydratase